MPQPLFKVVPNHRLPQTLDTIPVGFKFYSYPELMLVYKDGSASILGKGKMENDTEHLDTLYSAPPEGDYYAHLIVKKVEEGFDVTGVKLGDNYTFPSFTEALADGDVDSTTPLYPVVAYRERRERKPSVAGKKKGKK